MPRRKIERDFIVQYWHIDEFYNDERQIKLIKALAEEADFNDFFVVSNPIDESKLVCAQLD